ncbi:MAG: tRNA (N6-threonylcarbamoyladenosine(37)-N6)-methyltransferase TrmO [Solirubrobacteraceae bacterium]
MTEGAFELRAIGRVESPIASRDAAARQADEGAPAAWLSFAAWAAPALEGLAVGDEILVLTWLHLADRGVLRVHPRGDPRNPVSGVFATRSPDRPNPIGVHRTTIRRIDGLRIEVAALEAVDGTPIADVKPVLGSGA